MLITSKELRRSYRSVGDKYAQHKASLSFSGICDFLGKYATNKREQERFMQRLAYMLDDKTLSDKNEILTHVFLQLVNACKKNKLLATRMTKGSDDSVKWLYQSLDSDNLSAVYAEVSQYLPSKVKATISDTLGKLHHTHFRQFLFGEVPGAVVDKMKEECSGFSTEEYERVARFWRYDAHAFEGHGLSESQLVRFEQVVATLSSKRDLPAYTDCLRRRASEPNNKREFLNRLSMLLTDAGLADRNEVIDILINFYPVGNVLDQLVDIEWSLYKEGGAITFLPQYCKNIVSQCVKKEMSSLSIVDYFLTEYLRMLQAFTGKYPGGQLSLFPSSKGPVDPDSPKKLEVAVSNGFTDFTRVKEDNKIEGIFGSRSGLTTSSLNPAGIVACRSDYLDIFNPR